MAGSEKGDDRFRISGQQVQKLRSIGDKIKNQRTTGSEVEKH
jgi:hypothetical protein